MARWEGRWIQKECLEKSQAIEVKQVFRTKPVIVAGTVPGALSTWFVYAKAIHTEHSRHIWQEIPPSAPGALSHSIIAVPEPVHACILCGGELRSVWYKCQKCLNVRLSEDDRMFHSAGHDM